MGQIEQRSQRMAFQALLDKLASVLPPRDTIDTTTLAISVILGITIILLAYMLYRDQKHQRTTLERTTLELVGLMGSLVQPSIATDTPINVANTANPAKVSSPAGQR